MNKGHLFVAFVFFFKSFRGREMLTSVTWEIIAGDFIIYNCCSFLEKDLFFMSYAIQKNIVNIGLKSDKLG